MLLIAALVVFPMLMIYAAASDLLTMTIANWVSISLVLSFLVFAVISGISPAVILEGHLACGAAVLALTFALFAFGWIGGGDAKLAGATAVWLGWVHLYDYGLEASLLGGGLTFGILALRKYRLPPSLAGLAWVERIHKTDNGIPYGIALAAAGLILYPDTAIWAMAASS